MMSGTALVTGATKRIGRELTLKLADMGYNIALHYNFIGSDARQLMFEIEQRGVPCELFRTNFLNEFETESLMEQVAEKFDDVCLLVNNASIFQKARFLETDTALFNSHFDINFKAPFILTRDFAKTFKNGHVINILDTKIAHNDGAHFVYTLSKKVFADFTRMAAKQLAPDIRVNAIAPGFILPPAGHEDDKTYIQELEKMIPLKTKGEVHDIINAMEYLIENPYVTGQILYIDGGKNL